MRSAIAALSAASGLILGATVAYAATRAEFVSIDERYEKPVQITQIARRGYITSVDTQSNTLTLLYPSLYDTRTNETITVGFTQETALTPAARAAGGVGAAIAGQFRGKPVLLTLARLPTGEVRAMSLSIALSAQTKPL